MLPTIREDSPLYLLEYAVAHPGVQNKNFMVIGSSSSGKTYGVMEVLKNWNVNYVIANGASIWPEKDAVVVPNGNQATTLNSMYYNLFCTNKTRTTNAIVIDEVHALRKRVEDDLLTRIESDVVCGIKTQCDAYRTIYIVMTTNQEKVAIPFRKRFTPLVVDLPSMYDRMRYVRKNLYYQATPQELDMVLEACYNYREIVQLIGVCNDHRCTIEQAFRLLRYRYGLDLQEQKYVVTLRDACKQLSLQGIASRMYLAKKTVEAIEESLLRKAVISIETKGREFTDKGYSLAACL